MPLTMPLVPIWLITQVMFRKKRKSLATVPAAAKMPGVASISLYLSYPSCRHQPSGKAIQRQATAGKARDRRARPFDRHNSY